MSRISYLGERQSTMKLTVGEFITNDTLNVMDLMSIKSL